MQGTGSTPLARGASCVQQDHCDSDTEDAFAYFLIIWLDGTSRVRRQLGNPHTIVLETELVVRLATRLRNAPWMAMLTWDAARPRNRNQLHAAESALKILGTLFTVIHDSSDGAAAGSAHLTTQGLRRLLQQVCYSNAMQ